MRRSMLAVYSAAHFFVDFACAFLMFAALSDAAEFSLCLLLYNFCAFAMQMPMGLLADMLGRNGLFAAVGCLLVAGGYALAFSPFAAAIVAGIGNGMFHVGGGVDVLNHSERKSGALGIFVSPGALGIFLGPILARSGLLPIWAPPVVLAVAAAGILLTRARTPMPENAPVSLRGALSPGALLPVICLFLVVCLRGYAGLTLPFAWKGALPYNILLIAAVVLGKTAGGLLADRIGFFGASILSLGAAAILFLFGDVPGLGIAAVFLFNMTMPITLWAVAKIMPNAKGFSFGLLTFALFIGYLPVWLDASLLPAAGWAFGALAAVSLALLIPGLRRATA